MALVNKWASTADVTKFTPIGGQDIGVRAIRRLDNVEVRLRGFIRDILFPCPRRCLLKRFRP